ncbi:MAG: hypothetical protein MKZ75_06085 [Acidimicrobiales bacterium]|nr:hypothetical protein [Acidimicrobiales bacterium]MEC9114119.1 hypothetical protein [Actinomycetota bacterium]
MSIFFLSLAVSVAFGLWELCSSKHSRRVSIDHPSKGLRRQEKSAAVRSELGSNDLAPVDV